MCQNVRSAIDVIKVQSRKTLTKEETLMLFTKVIEDSEKIGKRMDSFDDRLSKVESKVDRVLAILEKPSLFEKIFLGEHSKYAWIFLIISLLIVAALLGVPTTGFNGILNIGG